MLGAACCCNVEEENAPLTMNVVPVPSNVGAVDTTVAEKKQPDVPPLLPGKEEGYSFTVELENTHEKNRPGLNVVVKNGRVIVTRVVTPGLISQWNALNGGSNMEVHIGDEIMSVGGVSDRGAFMRGLNTDGDMKIELQKPALYTIHLNKGENNLGLTVANQFITKIPDNGFFHQWLATNKNVSVAVGDFVLDVNGIKMWQKMRTELVNAESLVMKVAHYETAMIAEK